MARTLTRFLQAICGGAILLGTQIPGARADFPGDEVTKFVIGDIEGKADRVIDHAKDAGDFLIWRAGEQVLTLLDAWKKTNSDLLDKTFAGVDTANRKLFNGVNDTLDRIDTERQLSVADAQRLTGQWSQIISNLPMAGHDAELLNYNPRVIVPNGEASIPVHMLGPRLANANAKLQSSSGSPVQLRLLSEQELLGTIERKTLSFGDTSSGFATYKLQFNRTEAGLVQSAKPVDRDLTIWLLPRRLAHVTVKPRVRQTHVDETTFYQNVGGAAKDKPFDVWVRVPPDLQEQGWRIDTAKLLSLRPDQWIQDLGGDHGHCSGLRRETLSSSSFIFFMDMGHVTKGWGEKKDAHQNCRVTIPVIKPAQAVIVDATPIEGDMNWTDDKRIDLPDNTVSYSVELKMFNERSYIVTDTTHLPFGLLSIIDNKSFLVFRPNPPSDF